ncbi:ABC transporter substrate-binding protein [Streptantibioticus rubrisoli]|uniref:ABC transporter substrate-binding protein n=1 Tax=Streptantibioticus rubrisoli TaxID=1387313 RepID=A0ABT1PFU6_9ACTN|nr:ABC transporter substrate-binding protein [Streptantibioticus rubrisoli]MCQ4044243.1 ABC transporter substrate-binding protein [Streptantibioticus rubrisoli]
MNNAKIGAAVLGGYVLGRTKKAKLALSVGSLLAGSRMRPGQLVKAVQESPFLSGITRQVRTELTGAGKAAATSVLTAKADSLADAIHERTTGLHERAHPDDERDRGEGGVRSDRSTGQDRARESRRGEDREEEGRRGEERRSEGRRSEGHEHKARHRESDREESEPHSRPKSGSARSRRPDDG